MDTPLPDIKLKNSARNVILENTLIKNIVDKIKIIPQFDHLKNDIELTEHVCNLVENSITGNKNSKPIDKKNLVLKIITLLFSLNSEVEKKNIELQIDYLYNNNMINKIPLTTKMLNALRNTLIKNIVDKIKIIPQFDHLKNDIELTEHVCNLVENSITGNKNSKPIDKKNLVLKIITLLFSLNSEVEKKVIEQQIDYLYNNNMINKIPLTTKMLNALRNWGIRQIS